MSTDGTGRSKWAMVRLGDLLTEAQVGFASGERDSNGVLQIRMNNVTTRGTFDWSSILRVPADADKVVTYRLAPGDVLFNNTNSVELVGKSVFFEGNDEPLVFSNHFTRLRTNPTRLAPEFLALKLRSLWVEKVFEGVCNRWVGQAAVQRDKLLSLEFAVPPIDEQRRITFRLKDGLASVERARSAAEGQLVAAGSLTDAHLNSVFESSDAETWQRLAVQEFAATCSGATPPRDRPEYYEGTIPWVKTGELRDRVIEETEEHVNQRAVDGTSLRLLPPDTLLIAMYGQGQTRGRTGLLSIPATTNQACFAILPNPKRFDARFLQYWFMHSYKRLRRETEGRGGSQPNLNGEVLRVQEVPLPDVATQHALGNAISDRIEKSRRLMTTLEDQMRAIDQLPAALLRRAFNGEP